MRDEIEKHVQRILNLGAPDQLEMIMQATNPPLTVKVACEGCNLKLCPPKPCTCDNGKVEREFEWRYDQKGNEPGHIGILRLHDIIDPDVAWAYWSICKGFLVPINKTEIPNGKGTLRLKEEA